MSGRWSHDSVHNMLAQDKGGPSKGGFLNNILFFIYGSIFM